MAGRTPALTWRTLAALRATLANSSELAAPFPGRFSGADAPCATICTHHRPICPCICHQIPGKALASVCWLNQASVDELN